MTLQMDDDDLSEIKILVASDIHLGYKERDHVQKRDSFDSFEEVLQIAVREEVDMLLLGGDLFHENKPSRWTIFNCMELLRKYCLGERVVALEFVSDPTVNFDHSKFPHANYMDPSLNIGIPVFSINGNHDDLSGNGLSALDQLHAAGLVNYFGKYQQLDELNVSPVLLQKTDTAGNQTKLALYGFGAVRDERLFRLFQAKKVNFLTFDDANKSKDWYKILVLHQNRVKHGPTNYIPENVLPSFMDLVIWGHEHPCRIEPEETSLGFKIMQPGSTVATSLAEGEAGRKCVSLLRIKGTTMTDEAIELKTIRPFYFENILLSELDIKTGSVDTNKKVERYCDDRVRDCLERAVTEHPDNPRRNKPLIRLRIDYSGGFDVFNVHRFGNKYADTVANAKSIIVFHKKREQKESTNLDLSVLNKVLKQNAQELKYRVEDLVKQYFNGVEKAQKLLLLTDNALGAAVNEFVDKDEKSAIDEMVKQQLERVQTKIKGQIPDKGNDIDTVKGVLENIRDLRLQQTDGVADEEEMKVIKEAVEGAKKKRARPSKSAAAAQDDDEEVEIEERPPPKKTRATRKKT